MGIKDCLRINENLLLACVPPFLEQNSLEFSAFR